MPSSIFNSLEGGQLGGPGSDFVIVEWSDSGESEYDWIASLHVHHADDEAWYVLEGALRFRIGDELREVGAGGAVLAPKGTPHAFGNARRGLPARYLLVTTPKIQALVEALQEPGATDYAAILVLTTPSCSAEQLPALRPHSRTIAFTRPAIAMRRKAPSNLRQVTKRGTSAPTTTTSRDRFHRLKLTLVLTVTCGPSGAYRHPSQVVWL